MSDTENQENLSVEDILSSIKNILVDDEGAPIDAAIPEAETSAEETIIAPMEETPADVFNLDDSMIITPQPEVSEAPIAVEGPTVEQAIPDVSTDTINLQETLPTEEAINLSDIPGLDNLLDTSSEAPVETPVVTPAEAPVEESIPASVQDIVNSITLEEPAAPAKPASTASNTVVSEETIDTSASLINNFAKVFAEKQREQAQLKLNAQLTEEVVAKAIQDKLESLNVPSLVQDEILAQVKTQAGNLFEPLANKIITELTQKWIESNLQQVVEKAVTAEIERVIAKVEV